jgi:hypothetical protein
MPVSDFAITYWHAPQRTRPKVDDHAFGKGDSQECVSKRRRVGEQDTRLRVARPVAHELPVTDYKNRNSGRGALISRIRYLVVPSTGRKRLLQPVNVGDSQHKLNPNAASPNQGN